jgi:hypothetical protein
MRTVDSVKLDSALVERGFIELRTELASDRTGFGQNWIWSSRYLAGRDSFNFHIKATFNRSIAAESNLRFFQ